jgi:hypothetical protein
MPITTSGDKRERTATAELLAPPATSLPVPPAVDRAVWSAGHVDAPTLRELGDRAADDLTAPWPVPLARGYARYFRDGDRDGYEQVVFRRERRLSRAAVMAAVTLDRMWMDEVADGVTLLCEQSTWCWPAHDDTRRWGAIVPTVSHPFLDLGAGEVAAQLAWIDHLLGDQLDDHIPGVRARIRFEVDRRVLTPFVDRRDWHWLGLDGDVHNWSAWIHGNVIVAGLRLMAEGRQRAELVDLAVAGLERYVASIPPDGAIDEGYSYWWNGACRALEALDILSHATRGELGGVTADSLRETVAFPHRMHLGGDWYVNHADGPARPTRDQPWAALHRAARRVGDTAAQAHAAAHRRPGAPVARERQGLGRLLRALTDPEWVAAKATASPLPRDVWLASTQVLVARPEAGTAAGLTLTVKGGHNGEHHNHNDVGSVLVALNGVPVVVDAGRPTYTAQTFGPDRYAIWTMQSSWHNVPEIRDTAQAVGSAHAARDLSVHIDDVGTHLTLDLAGAYPRRDIRRWRRTAHLDRQDGRIRVSDSWDVEPGDVEPGDVEPGDVEPEDLEPARTVVHLLVAGTVHTGPGQAVVTALDAAGSVRLTWEPADLPATTTVRVLDDPMLSDVWGDHLTRLELDVTAQGPIGTIVWTLEETQ